MDIRMDPIMFADGPDQTPAERKVARKKGVDARNARKEARLPITCRYIDLPPGGLCGTEVADPDGEIRLCIHHLALTLELMRRSPLLDAILNQRPGKVA